MRLLTLLIFYIFCHLCIVIHGLNLDLPNPTQNKMLFKSLEA